VTCENGLLTGYQCGALFHNEGGRFRNVTEEIPLDRSAWTTSAAFFDAGPRWMA